MKLLSLLNVGKAGVYFDEMETPPQVVCYPDHLEIRTRNSIRHSAKEVYSVLFRKDRQRVLFSGFQRLVTGSLSARGQFSFSYQKLGIHSDQVSEVEMFWMDPDGKLTPLEKGGECASNVTSDSS